LGSGAGAESDRRQQGGRQPRPKSKPLDNSHKDTLAFCLCRFSLENSALVAKAVTSLQQLLDVLKRLRENWQTAGPFLSMSFSVDCMIVLSIGF
jgi:hypothetical protein